MSKITILINDLQHLFLRPMLGWTTYTRRYTSSMAHLLKRLYVIVIYHNIPYNMYRILYILISTLSESKIKTTYSYIRSVHTFGHFNFPYNNLTFGKVWDVDSTSYNIYRLERTQKCKLSESLQSSVTWRQSNERPYSKLYIHTHKHIHATGAHAFICLV